MATKIYIDNSVLGLGCFSLPILEFTERDAILKANSPQLDEQARAAVVYFGMLAEQPAPTGAKDALYIDYNKTPWNNNAPTIDDWAEIEKIIRYSSALGPAYLSSMASKSDAQTAYYKNLANLQTWLAYNGLTNGIQKTLNEESRKRQKELAQLQASNAAAAYASAMEKINAATTEEARREAAEKIGKYQEQLNENLERETQLKQELAELEAGILPGSSGSGISLPLVLGIGAAALLLLRKKRSKKE